MKKSKFKKEPRGKKRYRVFYYHYKIWSKNAILFIIQITNYGTGKHIIKKIYLSVSLLKKTWDQDALKQVWCEIACICQFYCILQIFPWSSTGDIYLSEFYII